MILGCSLGWILLVLQAQVKDALPLLNAWAWGYPQKALCEYLNIWAAKINLQWKQQRLTSEFILKTYTISQIKRQSLFHNSLYFEIGREVPVGFDLAKACFSSCPILLHSFWENQILSFQRLYWTGAGINY